MARVGVAITVSRVLDSRPRIFSLPVTVIVPTMFIVGGVGMVGFMLHFSGYMILLTVMVFVATYFFLFGQESWRLLAKFRRVPQWVRSDVEAVPFSLSKDQYEKETQRTKYKGARQQSAPRPHREQHTA